jgi:hypothetical protein
MREAVSILHHYATPVRGAEYRSRLRHPCRGRFDPHFTCDSGGRHSLQPSRRSRCSIVGNSASASFCRPIGRCRQDPDPRRRVAPAGAADCCDLEERCAALLAEGTNPGLTIGQTRNHQQNHHRRFTRGWIHDQFEQGRTSDQVDDLLAA